jgi:hypothetical protein
MLTHRIFDDAPHERERPVGFVYREQPVHD